MGDAKGDPGASLRAYRHTRLIVLGARTTAFEAARAMRTNEVGAIVVRGARKIVGIVTDRDLALRVVGEGLDPRTTTLDAILSPGLATLRPEATTADALRTMRERAVRRVPIVEGERVVGMVTLDDLVLDEAPSAELASVVRAQLVEGGPARTRRFDEWKAWQRRYARAEATKTRLVAAVQRATAIEAPERAEAALDVALGVLVRRLAPADAAKLVARLPVLLRDRLLELPPGPDPIATRAAMEGQIAEALQVELPRAAAIVQALGAVLASDVLAASDPLGRRLPADLRALLRRGRRAEPARPAPAVRRPAVAASGARARAEPRARAPGERPRARAARPRGPGAGGRAPSSAG